MQYTNRFNLPATMVELVNKLTYDPSESDPNRISITTLINPPRIRLLTVRHWQELEEDISDHIWRITGNAYHYILSNISEEDRRIEKKIEIKLDDITVVGKPDLYDIKLKSVEDYKVTSVWSVKEGIKEEWEQQLNCYIWLLRKEGLEVEKAYINAILRDWRKSESLKYSDYPSIPFKRLEIKVWTPEEQEGFVKEKIKIYKEVLSLPDDELPECSDKWTVDDKWAVYKNKNKIATRLLNTPDEANRYILELGDTKNKYRIEERKGRNLRCEEYCLVKDYCKFHKEVKNERK